MLVWPVWHKHNHIRCTCTANTFCRKCSTPTTLLASCPNRSPQLASPLISCLMRMPSDSTVAVVVRINVHGVQSGGRRYIGGYDGYRVPVGERARSVRRQSTDQRHRYITGRPRPFDCSRDGSVRILYDRSRAYVLIHYSAIWFGSGSAYMNASVENSVEA